MDSMTGTSIENDTGICYYLHTHTHKNPSTGMRHVWTSYWVPWIMSSQRSDYLNNRCHCDILQLENISMVSRSLSPQFQNQRCTKVKHDHRYSSSPLLLHAAFIPATHYCWEEEPDETIKNCNQIVMCLWDRYTHSYAPHSIKITHKWTL